MEAGERRVTRSQTRIEKLIQAAFSGHVGVVQELLAAGCDKDKTNVDGHTALMAATLSGHEGVVRLLLAAGGDKDKTNVKGYTALMMAARSGHEGVVRELLAAGCDQDVTVGNGTTALMLAADNIKMVFRNHFQDLFLAFTMACHTRLGAQVSKAKERCFIKDVLASKDLLQEVFQQGVLTYK